MLDARMVQTFIKHSPFPQDTDNLVAETDTLNYNVISNIREVCRGYTGTIKESFVSGDAVFPRCLRI